MISWPNGSNLGHNFCQLSLLRKFMTKIWAAKNLAQEHVIEAQERHEKSSKKRTYTQARCGSSGVLIIYILVALRGVYNLTVFLDDPVSNERNLCLCYSSFNFFLLLDIGAVALHCTRAASTSTDKLRSTKWCWMLVLAPIWQMDLVNVKVNVNLFRFP